jgi:hypothetical protein
MSFFSTILQKLGLKKDEPAATPAPVAPAASKPVASDKGEKDNAAPAAPRPVVQSAAEARTVAPAAPVTPPAPAAPAKPAVQAISEVDVVKKLEGLAEGSGLDWKVSIVDLLKLLEIDSSREARNELAKELGCPEDLMHDSAKMNVWLHKTVLKKIAENGGNIPQELLD